MKVFVDSNVVIYAVGEDSRFRDDCQQLFSLAALGQFELHASVEMLQEVLFHWMRKIGRTAALIRARHLMNTCVLHAFDQEVLERVLELVDQTDLRGRDAVHVATALKYGFDSIITLDADLQSLEVIRAMTPTELVGQRNSGGR